MSFDSFLQSAWRDHATDAEAVAARIKEGSGKIEKVEHVAQLARLVVHVYGEHLGRWQDGKTLIEEIRQGPFGDSPEAHIALGRAEGVFLACERGAFSPEGLAASDRIRVLATAASALSAQGQGERAESFFREALGLAAKIGKEDPAHRDLAVTGNNLAVSLEEKENRIFRDSELMLMAAHAARKHWEIAGTWLEVERAEYRLAMSFLAAGKARDALRHAENCLEIVAAHQAEPLESFFGFEALALSHLAMCEREPAMGALERMRALFQEMPEGERGWCQQSLDRLELKLAQ